MSAPAAFQGTYSDLKIVRTRKVAQIIVEIPLEAYGAFVAAFGAPSPGSETWVAIARLKAGVAAAGEEQKERRRFSELPLAQQAALKCGDKAFWRFINETMGFPTVETEESCADVVRRLCDVASRGEIKPETVPGSRWNQLLGRFDAWMRTAA